MKKLAPDDTSTATEKVHHRVRADLGEMLLVLQLQQRQREREEERLYGKTRIKDFVR